MVINERIVPIEVLDINAQPVRDATVVITTGDESIGCTYDGGRRHYLPERGLTGIYIVHVDAPGLESQTRTVLFKSDLRSVRFILGAEGSAYTFIDGAQIPYNRFPESIGVIARLDSAESVAWLRDLVDGDGYEFGSPDLDRIGTVSDNGSVHVQDWVILRKIRYDGEMSIPEPIDRNAEPALGRLRADSRIAAAGPVYSVKGSSISVFTHRLTVTFKKDIASDIIDTVLLQHGLEIVEANSWSPGRYLVEADRVIGERINDIAASLMANENVLSVTTELGMILPVAQYNPNDFLWHAQWSHKNVKAHYAWHILNGIDPNTRFGDSGISIAIFDDGIQSTSLVPAGPGTPLHPEFTGRTLDGVGTTTTQQVQIPTTTIIVGNGTTAVANVSTLTLGDGTEGPKLVTAIRNSVYGGTSREVDIHGINQGYLRDTAVTIGATVTSLLQDVGPAETEIHVASALGLDTGDIIYLEDPTDGQAEEVIIRRIVGTQLFTTAVRHPHAQNRPVEKGRKTRMLWDFTTAAAPIPNNNNLRIRDGHASNHGVSCAGISLARGDNNIGMVGVAPGATLIGIIVPVTAATVPDIVRWSAGIHHFAAGNLPILLRGTDIISASLGNLVAGDIILSTMDITRRGRGGRGTLFFIASGNEGTDIGHADLAGSQDVITVGATSLFYNPGTGYLKETRPRYSNWGDLTFDTLIISAPSEDGRDGYGHNPPYHHRMIATDLMGTGNLSANGATASTELVGNVNRQTEKKILLSILTGENNTIISSVDGIIAGDWLRIGEHGDASVGFVQVQGILGRVLTFDPAGLPDRDYIWTNNSRQEIFDLAALAPFNSNTIDVDMTGETNERTIGFGSRLIIGGQGYEVISDATRLPGNVARFDIRPNIVAALGYGVGTDVILPANTSTNYAIKCSSIGVLNSVGFAQNQWVMIGTPGTDHFEAQYVQSVPAANQMIISGPLNDYVGGAPPVMIQLGARDYYNRMGGTSAATPVAAGLAGLMLGVKPTLTWHEVRAIMKSTAVKVDIGATYYCDIAAIVPGAGIPIDPRWVDPQDQPILISTGVFQARSGQALITNAGGSAEGAYTVTVDNAAFFTPGNRAYINRAGLSEAVMVVDVDTANPANLRISFDIPLSRSYPFNATVETGVGTIATAGVAADPSIILNADDAFTFTVGQTIQIHRAAGGIITTRVTGTRNGDILDIDPPLPNNVAVGDNIVGGRVPYVLDTKSGTEQIVAGAAGVPAGADEFEVTNIAIFNPGCAVTIEAIGGGTYERKIIKSVAGNRIRLETGLQFPHGNGAPIRTGTTTVGGVGSAVGALEITVANSDSFVVGQAVRVVTNRGDALAVIREIPDATHLRFDPGLPFATAVGDQVQGGRIPRRSIYYGYGRIDANAAVDAARLYQHNWRDLMIRSYAGDLGTQPANRANVALSSPDIWVRMRDPAVDLQNALPAGYQQGPDATPQDGLDAVYNAPAPHMNPRRGADRYVYARIKNRGTLLPGLESVASIYVYVTRSNQPFTRPLHWADSTPPAGLTAPTPNTAYRLGAPQLFNAPIHGQAGGGNIRILHGGVDTGILPERHFIVRAQWEQAHLPTPPIPLAQRFRWHLLVEISPNDGELAGDTVGTNNNMASREISFAEVRFRRNMNNALPNRIELRRGQRAPTVQSYRIEIQDEIGYFQMRGVKLEVVKHQKNGAAPITVLYSWNGAQWVSSHPLETWVTFPTRPRDLATNAEIPDVAGDSDQIGVYFEGNINVDSTMDSIDINVRIESHHELNIISPVILEDSHTIRVTTRRFGYNDLRYPEGRDSELHGFAEMAKLTQPAERAFGPISNRKFRVTSGFDNTEATRVYAAATGLLFVQRVWDPTLGGIGGYDPTYVNVIIKPLYRSSIDFTPVKYYVYRGLPLTDFLTIVDQQTQATEVRSRTNASTFITELHLQQDARRNAMTAIYTARNETPPQDRIPPENIASDVLGWDSSKDHNEFLDPFFNAWSDANGAIIRQLPVVRRGMWIGTYGPGSPVGFEVVLEGGTFEPRLNYARSKEYVIDLDLETHDDISERHRREDVLCFVDPAAYYGMHAELGVYVRSGETASELKTEGEIFDTVLDSFATRNRLYVDIRSEHDYSLHYYRAASGGGLRKGAEPDEMSTTTYEADGWPMLIVNRPIEEQEGDGSHALYLSIPRANNEEAVVYVAKGEFVAPEVPGRFIAGGALHEEGAEWTKPIGITIRRAVRAQSNELADLAGVVRLHVGRGVDSDYVWPADSKVPKLEQYTDNLFGPFGLQPEWNTGSHIKTKWVSAHDLRYVGGTSADPQLGFGSVVERGMIIQPGQKIFYNSAVDFHKVNNGTEAVAAIGEGTEGGFSPRDTFWNASSLLDGFSIETMSIRETPPNEAQEVEVKLVKLTPKEQNAIPEGFMAVGLNNAQYNALDAVAGSLSDKHTRNLILKRHIPTQPATHFTYNGIAYQRYSVELRGLHPQTLVSTDVAPASHVYVYSADGLLFLPAGFDTTALVPTGYQPDQEESRAKTRSEVETIVTGDSQMQSARDTFITTVGGITAENTSAKALLTTAINTAADAMLARARTHTPLHGPGDQRQDDRPLYWSRLQMMAALKGNGYVLAHTSDGAELVQLFEKRSRGLATVDFTQQAAVGKKKVLLAGFDPFDLGYDIWNSNPSGIVALDLHGKPLTGPVKSVAGFIQAVIFPMRYRDFNNGMVEEFFEQYLYTNAVDLIITMGMNDSRGSFDIDRFAARHRAPKKDNDDRAGLGTVGTGTGWNEFYESELSISDTMSGETVGDPSQVLFYDQSYRSREEDGDEHSMAHPADDPTRNLATPIPGLTLGNIIGNSEAGSAGNYLANELFYRVARLRDRDPGPGSSVKTGHLSFPAPIYTNGAMTMKEILDTARDIIARAIDGL